MEQKKINKIAVVALIFGLIAISQSSAVSTFTLNLIAGSGINISQSGDNYTISATGNGSGGSDNTKVNKSGDNMEWITVNGSTTITYSGIETLDVQIPVNSISTPFFITINDHWHINEFFDIIGDRYMYIEGVVSSLSSNITRIENKTSQTGFMLNINNSFLQTDFVLIPYDMYLNNISTQLNNNTGHFNYSVQLYSSYPSGLTNITAINTSTYLNVTNMNQVYIPRHSTIKTTYHNSSNISTVQILFELVLK